MGGFIKAAPYGCGYLQNLYWIAANDFVVSNPDQATRYAAHYIQTADIDASAAREWGGGGWTGIGKSTNSFAGAYDGGGHTISGLYINREQNFQGLFGWVSGAAIKNLGLIDVDITGGQYVGGLIGWSSSGSTVTNSYATGAVNGTVLVGGLIGDGSGSTVTNSYAAVAVSGSMYVGGLIGVTAGSDIIVTVTNSYATGAVSGNSNVGGLIGRSYGNVANSYATGAVSGSSDVGGLIGHSCSNVGSSYATGAVSGNSDVGGLIGYSSGSTITNSYSNGAVSGNSNIGGLVGYIVAERTVSNSYATGDVTRKSGSTHTTIGAFCGSNDGGTIANSYSIGSVFYEDLADPTDKGFAGDAADWSEHYNNFWDSQGSV